jgi:hypothetical protein
VLNALFEGRAPGTRKIVTTCPHCFNTLGREYPQLDGHYEVVHHTQLLNTLVREGRLVPVATPDGELADVTYHDPCYLGRHNEVYAEPRELVGASGVRLTEMPRHADRSFCCGAGGARMWMEEKIGKRVNLDRVDEALGTGAEDRHRLPVLPGHAVGRPHPTPERGAGNRGRGPRRRPAPAGRGHARRPWPGRPRPDDAVGAGAPGWRPPPPGTQVNGSGPASTVSADPSTGPAALTRHRPTRGTSSTPRRRAGSGWVYAWAPSRSGAELSNA